MTRINQSMLLAMSVSPDSLLRVLPREQAAYGENPWKRLIAHPDDKIGIGMEFKRTGDKPRTITQRYDMACIYTSLEVSQFKFASNPSGANLNVAGKAKKFIEMLEQIVIEGSPSPVVYGLGDQGAGSGSTTVERPDAPTAITTAGDWSTTGNIKTDFINADAALIAKGFTGKNKVALLPSIARPMLTDLIANTAIPISQWFSNMIGYPVVFSSMVRENDMSGNYTAATKDAFTAYLIDLDHVLLVTSPLLASNHFSSDQKTYYWDWEIYATVAYNPLYDGTDWIKGVVAINDIDWSD